MQQLSFPDHSASFSGRPFFIEPLITEPEPVARILRDIAPEDWPETLVELHRIGVPRFVTNWLLHVSGGSLEERQLVRTFCAFVVHRWPVKAGEWSFWRAVLTGTRQHWQILSLRGAEELLFDTLMNQSERRAESWESLVD